MRMMLRPLRRQLGGDEGFTLIEQVMALFVASLIFMALAGSAISGIRASLTSRQNQQATDFMTRSLEQARLAGFAGLGHNAASVAGMTGTTPCGSTRCFDPGTGTSEPLVTLAAGSAVVFETTPTAANANNSDFTVRTYVTQAAGQDPAQVRRVTVVISWQAYGQSHTRRTSSLVALTQRGLPLPSFKLVADGSQAKTFAPGATAVFAARLSNHGATDSWNLAVGSALGTWSLYRDADGDGAWTATDPLYTDNNGDGTVDTGTLTPTGSTLIFLVRTLSASESPGTSTITLSATSVGQPSAASASQSLPFTMTISTVPVTPTPTVPVTPPAGDCAASAPAAYVIPSGYTGLSLALHNADAATPDTTARSPLVMNGSGPYLTSLGSYSTDVSSLPGRDLQSSSQSDPAAETDVRRYVEWRHNPGEARTVNGSVRMHLWVNASAAARDLNVLVYTTKSNGDIDERNQQEVTIPASTCSGWQEVWLETASVTGELDGVKQGVTAVRISTNDGLGVRIAYDAAAYNSSVTFAQK